MAKKNGCFNREIKDAVLVQDGYKTIPIHGGIRVGNYIEIPFRMSKDCKYDMRKVDAGCSGCKHQ